MSRFVTSEMDKLLDQVLLEYTTLFGCGCVVTVNPKSTWSADHNKLVGFLMEYIQARFVWTGITVGRSRCSCCLVPNARRCITSTITIDTIFLRRRSLLLIALLKRIISFKDCLICLRKKNWREKKASFGQVWNKFMREKRTQRFLTRKNMY